MVKWLVRDTRALLAALDVEAMSGGAARELVEDFAELERLAAAGKLLENLGRMCTYHDGPEDAPGPAKTRAAGPTTAGGPDRVRRRTRDRVRAA